MVSLFLHWWTGELASQLVARGGQRDSKSNRREGLGADGRRPAHSMKLRRSHGCRTMVTTGTPRFSCRIRTASSAVCATKTVRRGCASRSSRSRICSTATRERRGEGERHGW